MKWGAQQESHVLLYTLHLSEPSCILIVYFGTHVSSSTTLLLPSLVICFLNIRTKMGGWGKLFFWQQAQFKTVFYCAWINYEGQRIKSSELLFSPLKDCCVLAFFSHYFPPPHEGFVWGFFTKNGCGHISFLPSFFSTRCQDANVSRQNTSFPLGLSNLVSFLP